VVHWTSTSTPAAGPSAIASSRRWSGAGTDGDSEDLVRLSVTSQHATGPPFSVPCAFRVRIDPLSGLIGTENGIRTEFEARNAVPDPFTFVL